MSLDAGEPSRFEVLLSALILPGAGQWVQGRRQAAVIYAGLSLVCVTAELWVVLVPLTTNLKRMLAPPSDATLPEFASYSIPAILFWLIAFLIVYAASALDTYRAYTRRLHQWRKQPRRST